MEEWRDVKGFEGLYQVSNAGDIRSVPRILTLKCGRKRRYKGVTLAKARDSKGYLTAHLTDGKSNKSVRFHRVVAETFIPNPEGLPQVNHIDGDKENNAVSNLEWCSDEYNKAHAEKHGLAPLRDSKTGRLVKRSVKNGNSSRFR